MSNRGPFSTEPLNEEVQAIKALLQDISRRIEEDSATLSERVYDHMIVALQASGYLPTKPTLTPAEGVFIVSIAAATNGEYFTTNDLAAAAQRDPKLKAAIAELLGETWNNQALGHRLRALAQIEGGELSLHQISIENGRALWAIVGLSGLEA